MKSTLDIIALVQNNPLTRLSSDYGSKIIERINRNFTEQEQHLFVANFYCYLNYDTRKDFVIDLDNIWKWLGFGKKSDCKNLLVNNFIENEHYKINLTGEKGFAASAAKPPNPLEEPKNLGGAGMNKETILLTIYCFKKLCLKTKTKKSDQIHEYYIKMEEMMNELVDEQTTELRIKLSNGQKQLENKDQQLEKTLIEKHKDVQCIYYGYIDNTNDEKEKLIKFGETINLETRTRQHKKDYENFRLINAHRVYNSKKIETAIKQDTILHERLRKIKIKEENSENNVRVELLAIDSVFTIDFIEKRIKKIIKYNDYTIDNLLEIMKEKDKIIEKLSGIKRSEDESYEKNLSTKINSNYNRKCPDCASTIKNSSTRCMKCASKTRRRRKIPDPDPNSNPDKKKCPDCDNQIVKSSVYCRSCAAKKQKRKVPNRPSFEQLKSDIEEMSMVAVGVKYKVSDNCIRKWIKSYEKMDISSK